MGMVSSRSNCETRPSSPCPFPPFEGIRTGILWKESLACLVSSTTSSITNNSVCLPKFSSLQDLKNTEPTTLEPGQEISTTVNPLLFSNFPEIAGYSQLSFRFCLGKTVALSTFYYNASYHDKIKLKIKAGVPTRPIGLGD